ncbi:Penicillinase repressor [Natrinema salifodinae]|uniref:Penicillinase repressor n=2 Tax=Natrinema salifodinae TaxID=1202768 RepID=A0A1I0NB08_9EURY|nr:Penicillinase repressor [Natrinema salifodinae]
MLATGLFSEYGHATWQGRYVLPYFDEAGDPVYAIARCTGSKGGGNAGYDGHPADFIPGKYAKMSHTKDYAEVDEPIYGLSTLKRDGPVIITEGIADAITTHEAGYACLSPVTTRFKQRHRELLLERLEGDRLVIVIQDAEVPGSSYEDEFGLDLPQFGPGIEGAVQTAHYLHENGVDARLGELPLLADSLQKVDLDDYLQEWSDTLAPIVSSAKPAAQHPAHDPTTREIDVERTEVSPSGEGSALWNLTMPDVTGLNWGYRGPSPLGHHGDSEDYFLLLENRQIGYDHKYDATYHPVTYLLCNAGVRRQNNPEGPLTDEEKFESWRYAKAEGLIPSDDEVPYAALRGVALKHGLCERDDITDGWKLTPSAYLAAIETIENEYGLESGRNTNGEPVALIPSVSNEWDWRSDEPSIPLEEARSRCQAAIEEALINRSTAIIDALPSMGKSRGVIKAAAGTGEPLTILVGRGHEEMYEQYEEWCEEDGLKCKRLPSFTSDCETANGTHGDAWRDRVMEPYSRGATGRDIHMRIEDMPCKEDGCTYRSQWSFDPDEYDVLIGHYTHAHVYKAIQGRAVAFDEFPGGAFELDSVKGLPGTVSTYLEDSPLPVNDFTELIECRRDPALRDEALRQFASRDGIKVAPDADQAFTQGGHSAAPFVVLMLIFGEEVMDGWEVADIESSRCLWHRPTQTFYMLTPPDLLPGRGVIGLDGTPTSIMWNLALDQRFTHREVLDKDERSKYITETMSIELVRTTESIKPSGKGGRYVNVEDDTALFENIAQEHDEKPALIAPQAALKRYEQSGALEYIDGTQHYGNLLGSNEFKHLRVGVVSGSMHYGDRFIEKWAAYADEDIDREGKGVNLTYGDFGDKILTHMREHQTLQAMFRFGRDGNGARVYINTNTLPDWIEPHDEARVVRCWSDGERQILEVINDLDEWKTSDLIEHPDIEISKRQIHRVLNKLTERGYVTKTRKGRALVWRADGDCPEHGDVELG